MEIKRPISKQPIPENAKKVFTGVIFDVYQWETYGYDGKKRIFEKLKRPDTAGIIPITPNGEIIIALQEQPNRPPFMGTIGRRVDEGEDVLEAAKRELLEETGYTSEDWILFDAIQPVGKIEWATYTFIAKGCKKITEQNLDGAERVELKFVSFDEFINLAVTDDKFGDELRVKILEAKLDPKKYEELKELFKP